MDANVIYRQSRQLISRTSPLAAYDGSPDVKAFVNEFALKPAEEFYVLTRPLALAIASEDGTRVRVVTGILHRQIRGQKFTLCDEDGFIVGSVSPRQIVGWSSDPAIQLEKSAVKHLEEKRFARWDRELDAAMDVINATATRDLVAA